LDQYSFAFGPHPVELLEEDFVLVKAAELAVVLRILLQVEVWRGRDYQLHGFVRQLRHRSCVTLVKGVLRGNLPYRPGDRGERLAILGEARNRLLGERREPEFRKILLDEGGQRQTGGQRCRRALGGHGRNSTAWGVHSGQDLSTMFKEGMDCSVPCRQRV